MSAPSLRDTQRWLAGLILDPARLDDAPTDASRGFADPATARVRLGAYADGYPARIEDALAETYPALRHVLGGPTFHDLMHRYLPHVPAGLYSLTDAGAALPEYLDADPVAASLPLAPDLARLERAVQRAFHAALAPPFDAALLAGWALDDWDRAVLRFQAGVALVRSRWPVADVWEARKLPRDAIDIAVEGRPQSVLVYRIGHRVAADVVGASEAAVLARLLAGGTLGDTMMALATDGDKEPDVGGWIAGWVGRGIVAGCDRTV
jgi:hypothetical protein